MQKFFWVISLALLAAVSLAEARNKGTPFDVENSHLSLPPPPAQGSEAEKRDFEILFKYQAERTEEDCAVAKTQSVPPSMNSLYGPKSGLLTKAEFDRVKNLGNALILTAALESKPFKEKYRRVRPYDTNEDLKPCVHIPGGQTSYPSAHAAAGTLTGEVFAKIFPEKAERLRKAGYWVGEYRVLGGVHHPSDVIAGRALAKQILEELTQDEDFRDAFEEAKED